MIRTDTPSELTQSSEAVLADLVEEITEKIEAGEHVDLASYEAQHPALASQLSRLVPALQALHDLGLSTASSMQSGQSPNQVMPTGQLGDFRILQEIGRGGMGVVYEAEQISIGRRVALKVLPFAAMLDKQQLNRFKNEARAAGTLDHPNIVSVFSVGTERGVHYYAMQLVEGQSLAEVIAARRKDRGSRSEDRGKSAARNASSPSSSPLTPRSSPNTGEAPTIAHDSALRTPHSAIETRPVAALSTIPNSNTQEYFRTVAQLGIQAAEALDHAHQNGIVHRDVKPANLLVDAEGKLHVTDFGLARIEADAGMTMTGDILGTLRYMSPEQALAKRVVVDHRADVYSLGATLYELLSLQPAYQGADRQELLKQIAFEEPKKLREHNPHVPFDLATIVAKAMEKNPSDRYETAQEMGSDLARFLSDEPIRARPPTVLKHLVKWSRRHVGSVWMAIAMLTCVAIVSTVCAALLSTSYREAKYQRDLAEIEATENRRLLYAAEIRQAYQAWQTNNTRRVIELLKRQIPQDGKEDLREFIWHYLWKSCHSDIRTLNAHESAVATIDFSPNGRLLATGAEDGTIKLWDTETWSVQDILEGHPSAVRCVVFAPDSDLLASGSDDQTVRLWRPSSGQLIATLKGHSAPLRTIAFAKDGTWMASGGLDRVVKVWDPVSSELNHELAGPTNDVHSLAVSPDGKTLAAGDEDGWIRAWRVDGWKPLQGCQLSHDKIFSLDWSADSKSLVAGGRRGRVNWLKRMKNEIRPVGGNGAHHGWLQALAVGHSGTRVASTGRDGVVVIREMKQIDRYGKDFRGHTSSVESVAWSPDDRSLVTGSDSGKLKLWDPDWIGQGPAKSPILDGFVWKVAWLPNGEGVVTVHQNGVARVWNASTLELRSSFALHDDAIRWLSIAPQRNAGVTASADGTAKVWRLDTGETLMVIRDQSELQPIVATSPDGASLVTVNHDEAFVQISLETGKILQRFATGNHARCIAFCPDGRFVEASSGGARLWDLSTAKVIRFFPDCDRLAVDCSGELLAKSHHNLVQLRDMNTGTLLATLDNHTQAVEGIAFTPDGMTLATCGRDGSVCFWDVRTGQELMTHSFDRWMPFALAFSPDGKQLIVAANRGESSRLFEWSIRE